jgi:hypothetical protein
MLACMSTRIAYIAQGKIHLLEPGRPARLIESKFGQSVLDRASQIQQRNAWKMKGTGARFMSGAALWGGNAGDATAIPMAVTGVSCGTQNGELVYSIATDEITGVFALRNDAKEEQRLFHTADFRISQLRAHPTEDRIACVVMGRGFSNIAVMRGDGCELSDVTQGDSIDRAPSWVPGANHDVVYQSSGVARDQKGNSVGVSAARIERLNAESGEITTLLEDPHYDYLDPQVDGAGNLYCIRKPTASLQRRFNPLRALLDLVLLPFRLLYALFQFVNFFTARYTGKTLVTSGDARQKRADMMQMMMLGNLMQAQHEAEAAVDRDKEGLVSRKWELLKKSTNGQEEVVQRGVLSFDLCADGSVVYTNGSRIFHLGSDGKTETLGKDELISQVLALPKNLTTDDTD